MRSSFLLLNNWPTGKKMIAFFANCSPEKKKERVMFCT